MEKKEREALDRIRAGKSFFVVKVKCRSCGALCGPLSMDGKPYTCNACGELLFGGKARS